MAITFHCRFCDKKIQAPDSSAGKWGKCPSCHNKLYVPDLSGADELKLAPINEEDEMKQKKLMEETYKLTHNILGERELPDEPNSPKPAASAATSGISDKKLMKNITAYLKQMADGQLDKAEKTAKSIIAGGSKAADILDEISSDTIALAELADIPEQVLSGLIKGLRNKIG